MPPITSGHAPSRVGSTLSRFRMLDTATANNARAGALFEGRSHSRHDTAAAPPRIRYALADALF